MNAQSRFVRLVDAVSQFFNVLVFNGDPNHSLSGDAYRYDRRRLKAVIEFIFMPLEFEHCKLAHQNDIRKASLLLREQKTGA